MFIVKHNIIDRLVWIFRSYLYHKTICISCDKIDILKYYDDVSVIEINECDLRDVQDLSSDLKRFIKFYNLGVLLYES